uniref:lysozyme g-like isoform X2 n=1 Tax=Doryrhamphus excisus TaxID=161450 RepID=UPI0025AE6A16|nr:lysozyme g-like isoform X2 [Doryrhamphus excisus]XP_057907097.1 lysozyme g-like isoform X2 [Doryrhamphus excisus]XP_057907098.1 lysozyme g-like isoform X2 [Doryrhamphus excisus]
MDGNIMKIKASGAGARTSRQDNLSVTGEAASHTMAQTDLARMNKLKPVINKVAQEKGIEPAVLAGIISRESRGGNALDASGCGDGGNAFGVMQVDKRYHTPQGDWNSEQHVRQGAEILTGFVRQMKQKFPNSTPEEQLRGGIAAYNCGPNKVQSLHQMDSGTYDGDYSSDVVARAQWYKQNGGF